MGKPQQLSLFDIPTFNIARDLKASANEAARKSRWSRDEIVDKMNDLAGRYGVNLVKGNGHLTVETFEKWLAVNDMTRVMPIAALPVFCAVVDDWSAIAIVARPLGLELIGREDQQLLRWAKIKLRHKQEGAELRSIEKEIGV